MIVCLHDSHQANKHLEPDFIKVYKGYQRFKAKHDKNVALSLASIMC